MDKYTALVLILLVTLLIADESLLNFVTMDPSARQRSLRGITASPKEFSTRQGNSWGVTASLTDNLARQRSPRSITMSPMVSSVRGVNGIPDRPLTNTEKPARCNGVLDEALSETEKFTGPYPRTYKARRSDNLERLADPKTLRRNPTRSRDLIWLEMSFRHPILNSNRTNVRQRARREKIFRVPLVCILRFLWWKMMKPIFDEPRTTNMETLPPFNTCSVIWSIPRSNHV